MTVPNFLLSSFVFTTDQLVTDVSSIITDLTYILAGTGSSAGLSPVVTLSSTPWTATGAGPFTYKSPVDAAGRFMTVILTRTTAVRLEVKLTDQNGATIYDREIDINASGSAVNYYAGQYHLWIEIMNGGVAGTAEVAHAAILDPSPYANGSNAIYVIGNAYRSTASSVDGQGSAHGQSWSIENGASAVRNRIRGWGLDDATTAIGLVDMQGNPQFFPVDAVLLPQAKLEWGGRYYQAYMTDTSVPNGAVRVVGIDDATLGTFRVLSFSINSSTTRIAVRIA